MTARRFIAHRGVHLGSTASGENSLEAVELARRAGFACIETDVRLSADGEFVVMHDETLDRTVTYTDGRKVDDVRVDSVPLPRLRSDYLLKARDPENRTRIPTLEEYLQACVAAGLVPFIEFKLDDQPAETYLQLLAIADRVVGRGGYVMTSNGNANRAIRALGIHDVPMMDILYQAPSFADVVALGDVTVAISATRYERAEHRAWVEQAWLSGLETELHADDVEAFAIATEHRVDLISTDVLAPDLHPAARILLSAELGDDALPGDDARLAVRTPGHLAFGGMFLEFELTGRCEVHLGPQRFTRASEEPRIVRHQVMVFDAPARFSFHSDAGSRIRALRLTVAAY